MGRTTYRRDAETGEFIPLEEWYERNHVEETNAASMINRTFESFKSTIDGTIISDNRQLEAHNKRNKVTNINDYSEDHFAKASVRMRNEATGNTAKAEGERRSALVNNLRKAGIRI